MRKTAVAMFVLAGLFLIGALVMQVSTPVRSYTWDEMIENPDLIVPGPAEIVTMIASLLAGLCLVLAFVLWSKSKAAPTSAPTPEAHPGTPLTPPGDTRGLGVLGPWLMVVVGLISAIGGPILIRLQMREAQAYFDTFMGGEASQIRDSLGWVLGIADIQYIGFGLLMIVLGGVFLLRSRRR